MRHSSKEVNVVGCYYLPMFAKQFLGKTTAMTFVGIAAVHLLAIPLQHAELPSLVALVVIFIATLVLSGRSLLAGLVVAFAEIMVGGHGHLISSTLFGLPLSLRMVIFAAVMLGFLWQAIRHHQFPRFVVFRDTPFLLLAAAIGIGTVNGMLNNSVMFAFDDMNGYLTLAYLLPVAAITWDNTKRRHLLQVLFASVVWIALSSLLLLYLFTHLPGKMLHEVYRFVRDARLAEVTLLTGPDWFVSTFLPVGSPWYFRIFEPAHFFTMVMGFIVIAAGFTLWKGERIPQMARVVLVLSSAAFIVSLSRSFLVGALAGLIVTKMFILPEVVKAVGKSLVRKLQLAFLVVLGAGVFWATIVFPFPSHPNLKDAAFYRESDGDSRDLAVSSRWNLLYPMFEAIMEHPVLGSGFGTEVTFVSDDPRVREINPSGEWTTYRFEWGYQDIWLKMGLLGLIGLVWYVIAISRAFYFSYHAHGHRWLVIGLYAGVVALFATHIFSPYLNHPIGLGYMVFVLPFFDWQGLVASFAAQAQKEQVVPITATARPVISMRK